MSTADSTLPEDRGQAIESFLFEWADEFDVPGAAAVVVSSEDELVATSVGSRHLLENSPATPDTLFAVGSVTKSFTATTVMQLAETGELSLEDSPAEYTEADFEGIEDITLHDLLCHNSGLPSLAVSESLIAQQTDYTDPTVPIGDREDFHRYLAGAGGEVVDGDHFLYSNSGYMLLAETVSNVRGRPFHEVVETEVLDQLGMDRSTMLEASFEADDNTITPYRRDDETDRWNATPMPVRELSRGPGGLFTSPRELGSYLRMYLNGGLADDGTQVLTADSIEQMTDGHVETSAGPYGYAWRTVEYDDFSIIGHGGSVGVATAYAGWSADLDLGVAVACNASAGHGLRVLGTALAHIASGEDPYETHPFFTRHARRQQLIGSYETYRGARTASIEEHGGFLQLTLEDPLPLAPTSLVFDEVTEDGYRYWAPTDDGKMELEFRVDGSTVELLYDRWRLYQTDTA